MEIFTTSQLAAKAGVINETIRYYERKGLLLPPERTLGGFRQYKVDDLKRLKFIMMAKEHGFTLKEIKELLELRVSTQSSCNDVREMVQTKIKIIEEKIRELQQIKNALKHLMINCHIQSPADECPILNAFDKQK